MRAEIRVSGIVQGVGFRPFVYRTAVKNKLAGYVQNRGDSSVEIVLEGKKKGIENFLHELKTEKPPLARIHDVVTSYRQGNREFRVFSIVKSSEHADLSGSTVSPDVSICDECLREMREYQNLRHNYFFITCTDCGPRYTIIEKVPYDRRNTTMSKFAMCNFCRKEYSDPGNRRFHAQTVACPKCGPKAYLTSNDGKPIHSKNPIREAGILIAEGNILAIKGYGGFHVATATTKSKPISKLRNVKHRTQKPFAIMARNLETVHSFAKLRKEEAELLTSYMKPIVLLEKNDEYYLSDLIAPNLHNVGVMLPYTGLHYLLFDCVQEPAFVMTSANPPNEPIVTEDEEALKKLGKTVDYFLFHNRPIAQRCDDSVVRVHGQKLSFIRRSRGYAPEPIQLDWSPKANVLGLGAELNVTSCILAKKKAFLSQHIGDVENLETFQSLKGATQHLMHLTNITKVETIACDMHPKFTTTKLAQELGEDFDCPVKAVQHHYAHAVSLMAETNIDEMIAIVCDGYGYGSDGSAWGGEVLHCNRESGFKRLGHLQPQSMIGGDLATRYPLRIAAGILGKITKTADLRRWLLGLQYNLPYGKNEVEIILKQTQDKVKLETTSCGRILDAVACILGICYKRTYEGEPAMKLESAALTGKDVLKFKPAIQNDVINTTSLVSEIFKKRDKLSITDLAFSAQSSLALSLAQLSKQKAEDLGVSKIGFSGGVAYNEHITSTMRSAIEANGLKFIVHELVPPGDGGISFGQAVASAWHFT